MKYNIKDIKLSAQGYKNLTWAEREMPVLAALEKAFTKSQPLKGIRIAACLHITKETGVLLRLLKSAGAVVAACGSNPLSTQDDIAASLAKDGISIFASKGMTDKEYYENLLSTLAIKPNVLIDDGADLIHTVHTKKQDLLKSIIGAMEETTTGVIRLKAMAREGRLQFPVIAVNDSQTKHLFDNHYGTAQSTIDGILRATNIMLAGKTVVVAGFGNCGSGLAHALAGLGSQVIVTEVDAVKALRATMDGFRVLPMSLAAKVGDIFITVTGNKDVITWEHMQSMKDGAIVCNSGHFNVEIAVGALEKHSKKITIRNNLAEHTFPNGKSIFLLAEGRLVNLASAEGHPSAVMDMSFANQALGVLYLLENQKKLSKTVHVLPKEVDEKIARIKLKSMNIAFDTLTPEQQKYLSSWNEGT